MKFCIIIILICIISEITSNEYSFSCYSKDICEECSESELGINGENYCLKCNSKNGYIGIAGICINKRDFPSTRIIKNCQSYSPNIAFCAVCKGDSQTRITRSCDKYSKDKFATKWIILICVLGGSFIIGLVMMIVLICKYGNDKPKSNAENINNDINYNNQNLPPLPNQVPEEANAPNEDEFYICDKYFCSKPQCNEQAVMKSDCNCKYLCLNHAYIFYSTNNLNEFKKEKTLKRNKQKCNECNSGFINEIKKISQCEKCFKYDFLESIENKNICSSCKENLFNNL